MIHLTPAEYVLQPWKNGRGSTTELWRLERDGQLLVRLSRAAVVEDGPFSIFPGIERNLTVVSGPGFRLSGRGIDIRCDPFVPVDFPGDVELRASETLGRPSDDFNVMTARSLPKPQVRLVQSDLLPAGGLLALYALGVTSVNGEALNGGDLVLTEAPAQVRGNSPVLVARLFGVALAAGSPC